MAYSLTFVNPEATLTDEEINKAMEKSKSVGRKPRGKYSLRRKI